MNTEEALDAGKEWQELSDFTHVDIDKMKLSSDSVQLILDAAEIMDSEQEQ